MAAELPIIQKTYDLIKWYVPLLNGLPREHKFSLGDRMVTGLYNLLESLVLVRYQKDKTPIRDTCNSAHISLSCLYASRFRVYYSAISSVENCIGQAMISSNGKGLVNKSRM